ncbi:hypothetical protein KAK07_23700 [Ideonella sp. 4Y16]|uniref:Uncharacterized protein n=1 Tax=Ideonella alba TaxID=2824118 RepID=A0A940Y5L8_9BURK|nr:HAD domain-containing protein [Ideonella alba]MBQ0930624.1 hypothetical protein [Ideonella alba]MBQ0946363.1 hypothetical protein [Ideonella alba]
MQVIFLDIDGVLHPRRAVAELLRTPTPASAEIAGRGLFRWSILLESVIVPADDVAIYIHSSWRHVRSVEELGIMLGPLGRRLAGVTVGEGRWESILRTVHRVRPKSWLVIDDEPSEFPQPLPRDVVICDPNRGVCCPTVVGAIKRFLADIN